MQINKAHEKIDSISVLMDMRPALDGFYGIPQETRLLFAALAVNQYIRLRGLLQMSIRQVKGGVAFNENLSEADRVHRFANTVVSIKGSSAVDWKHSLGNLLSNFIHKVGLRFRTWGIGGQIQLRHFDVRYFRDFVWQQLFARSVPPSSREAVLKCDYLVCSTPWRWMHLVGIERSWLTRKSSYPILGTVDVDVLIAQTPYPGRVAKRTKLVVHYHDAIPVLMPHTISDRAFHEASHYQALASNVRDGAFFVCVSESTRRDLLSLFPEAELRAVTIHNMLPEHYFPTELEPERLGGIILRYQHRIFCPPGKQNSGVESTYKLTRNFGSEDEKAMFYSHAFAPGRRYLLMVSTIEPRKNHIRLVEAWQSLRDSVDPDLKLVLVGHIGWDYKALLDSCLPGIERGDIFLLHGVPADSLRFLYRHAAITVCPSVGEGFDFAGAEAMRCGGIVAASDIPVHREVYGNAAKYFDPYDTTNLVEVLSSMMYGDESLRLVNSLRELGLVQSAQYLPEFIVPKWISFLERITQTGTNGIALR